MATPLKSAASSKGSIYAAQQTIWEGKKASNLGKVYDALVTCGLSPLDISELQYEWKEQFDILLSKHLEEIIRTNNPEIHDWMTIIGCDSKWRWELKPHRLSNDSTDWFFYRINHTIEGVLVASHPKASAIDSGRIFYVDYLCAAPQNRRSFFGPGVFSGIGTDLLACAQIYFGKKPILRYGFGLHSLPAARKFYTKLGLKNYPQFNSGTLDYLELCEASAKLLAEKT